MSEQDAIIARLDHVGLAVADLDAAVSWFCDVFGLGSDWPPQTGALRLGLDWALRLGPAAR